MIVAASPKIPVEATAQGTHTVEYTISSRFPSWPTVSEPNCWTTACAVLTGSVSNERANFFADFPRRSWRSNVSCGGPTSHERERKAYRSPPSPYSRRPHTPSTTPPSHGQPLTIGRILQTSQTACGRTTRNLLTGFNSLQHSFELFSYC